MPIWGVVLGLVAIAAGLLWGPVRVPDAAATPVDLPWWGIAIGFALTEFFVIHLHRRRDSHSLTLSEIPLLLGFAFLTPAVLVAARVVGAGVVLLARRQHPTKLAFNLALFAAETAVGVLVFRVVLDGAPPIGPRGWAAVLLATLATEVLGTISVTCVIWISESAVRLNMLTEVASIGTVLSLGNAAVATLVLAVAWAGANATLPLLAVGGFLYVAYRGYLSLRQRHATLQTLYQFTSATARPGETGQAAAGVLEEVAQLLRADLAELVLVDERGATVLRVRVIGDQLLTGQELPLISDDALAWALHEVEDGPSVFPAGQVPPTMLRLLGGVDRVRDAVIAPTELQLAEHLRGVIVAANRISDISTFDREDAAVLGALARHAGVALENGKLLERLRAEADEKAHLATHDSLTGLPNRLLLGTELAKACARARRDGDRTAVLLLDLDGFKQVNDTLGHAAGDQLLQEVADRLRGLARPQDVVARLGGDEFALVIPDVDDREALRRAERIIEELHRPWQMLGIAVDVRASIGVAMCPDHAAVPEELLQRADLTMYAAKDTGGSARLYDPSLDVFTGRRLALAAELRTALREGAIDVHYHPRLGLDDQQVLGVEALARWSHPTLGSIRPDEFVPIAEGTGLITQLTSHVLERAIRDVQDWHRRGHRIGVSVNIAARDVVDPAFPAYVAHVLRTTGFPSELLTLEVTESSMLSDIDRAVVNLVAMSEQGVDLAHNLGMSCVAEGVEEDEVRLSLVALGCEEAQGYLWTPPLPAAELVRWLDARTSSLQVEQFLAGQPVASDATH